MLTDESKSKTNRQPNPDLADAQREWQCLALGPERLFCLRSILTAVKLANSCELTPEEVSDLKWLCQMGIVLIDLDIYKE